MMMSNDKDQTPNIADFFTHDEAFMADKASFIFSNEKKKRFHRDGKYRLYLSRKNIKLVFQIKNEVSFYEFDNSTRALRKNQAPAGPEDVKIFHSRLMKILTATKQGKAVVHRRVQEEESK